MSHPDSYQCRSHLQVDDQTYVYFDLKKAEANGLDGISRLPFSLKVLLENLLRNEDGVNVTKADIAAVADWLDQQKSNHEIAFSPARVLMQDFTGVPAVVDLAAMRDASVELGAGAEAINPLVPVDLVIDHSVMVDNFAHSDSFKKNVAREYERNQERYTFLRWGGSAFKNLRVVPPGTGICHQVNLEYLAQTVWTNEVDGETIAYPDTLVGTDSHTTMINGLSVLGWGVGGIEAEAAMLGQPISMLIPEVIGFKLGGKLPEGATATDLVLTVVQMLRARGVVGKFVEFYGQGLDHLSLEDQATLANMAPEYGATCGFFPVDEDTITYLTATGRDPARVKLVESYAKAQGMWREPGIEPIFTDSMYLDMSEVVPSLSGPKRPQDRVLLSEAPSSFAASLAGEFGVTSGADQRYAVEGEDFDLGHGDVVIAAITSCTNTSNPSVMLGAGLLARNARAKGLDVKPWVKTSLAPGSKVVTDYLIKAGLQDDLDALGFNLVGYGCTTCIGNSGPLPGPISKAVNDHGITSCSVLSGNRNFEGRIGPDIRANYLASPPLVVAYAIAGTLNINLTTDPLGQDQQGNPVYLRDIWPSSAEIAQTVRDSVTPEMFSNRYADVFKGDAGWQKIELSGGDTYNWSPGSTYIRNPPFFTGMSLDLPKIHDVDRAQILGLFGDSITTDHISPAGAIAATSPAGNYLKSHQVPPTEFNSYGSRRGNHEVMMRGTFANIRIRNQMLDDVEGGYTKHFPDGEVQPIYDAAMAYEKEQTPLVIITGKEYGTGSSRDWAAKGTRLLGVRAVIAISFERIHRSNLIGMGVLPLQFTGDISGESLGLTGEERVSISGFDTLQPQGNVDVTVEFADGREESFEALVRIDTETELEYFKNGGILHYVLRNLARNA
ncbi:MAG: aconitate hydratase AcnA [Robiginitomaculum sp.]|nr:MAG: aconitate hydratase AcnA [Robiginitomaculum sp.]